MLLLIFDSKTAISGAQLGIDLCLKAIIPSLFPFFILSALIIQCKQSTPRWICRLFGIPETLGCILIPGLLGGYPVGAQSASQLYHNGSLSKSDAERVLAFCNNAGPAFLFGMAAQQFPKRWMVWELWGIHIAGAVVAARCIPCKCVPEKPSVSHQNTDIFRSCLVTMASVCGWIVLFRVVIAFLDRWILWLFPQTLRVTLIGLLELSNGCWELTRITSIPMRFFLCSGLLAIGGLCVSMQTASVTGRLSLRYYRLGKGIQLLVSLILSSCIAWETVFPLLLLFPFLLLTKSKNSSSNPAISSV